MNATKPISAFNYFGGKNNAKLLAWIKSKLEIVPVFHLAEPFAGSYAVSLNFKKAKIRTFNDLNSDIYNFFKVLRDHGEELIRKIELTPYCRQEYEALYMDDVIDPIEKARIFFLRTCQSFGNAGSLRKYNSWSYTINDSRYGCSQSVARYLSKVEGLQIVVNELRLIQFENIDFRKFINKYDSESTVFYIDPPYVHDSRSMHIKYKHELSVDDHTELADLLKNLKGKFLLSGYHSDLYDELYKDFYSDSLGSVKTNAGKSVEVLWANYNLTHQKMF